MSLSWKWTRLLWMQIGSTCSQYMISSYRRSWATLWKRKCYCNVLLRSSFILCSNSSTVVNQESASMWRIYITDCTANLSHDAVRSERRSGISFPHWSMRLFISPGWQNSWTSSLQLLADSRLRFSKNTLLSSRIPSSRFTRYRPIISFKNSYSGARCSSSIK